MPTIVHLYFTSPLRLSIVTCSWSSQATLGHTALVVFMRCPSWSWSTVGVCCCHIINWSYPIKNLLLLTIKLKANWSIYFILSIKKIAPIQLFGCCLNSEWGRAHGLGNAVETEKGVTVRHPGGAPRNPEGGLTTWRDTWWAIDWQGRLAPGSHRKVRVPKDRT